MNLTEATIKALQGKLTEYRSEIHKIYDDEGPELQDFVNEVDAHHDFIFAPLSRWKYGYFGEDIAKKGYEVLQNYLDDRSNPHIDVTNGETVHAHNIGNNNKREIICNKEDGDIVIGYLCITNDMYGHGIIWVEDLSNNKIGFKTFNRIDEDGAYNV